ncbi:MAG: NAD(P)-dependent alcohol dehydrogenase [Alphaproteobacteria bacterium]
MRAAVYDRFAGPDAIELREVARPVPRGDEVLVRVHAASVNSWDYDLVVGKPFLVRLAGGGLFRPARPILGADIAGRVTAVGPDARKFQPGDAVFGDISEHGWAGFAEYASASETAFTDKPDTMSFEQAAAIPQAALLALQGLRDKATTQPGDQVLINGAGGGAGTFAIQIAKLHGAEVTGVDHTTKLDLMRACGADHVLDYTATDYTATGKRYDLIVDMVARRSPGAYLRALTDTGTFVMIGGATGTILQLAVAMLVTRKRAKRITIQGLRPNTDDLDHMAQLFDDGSVAPVIDRVFPLTETAEALRYLGEGHALGKVVIVMEEPDEGDAAA